MENRESAVFGQLAEGLAERLDRPTDSFTPETTIESLGLDSLDIAELMIEMESRLGIEIETDEGKIILIARWKELSERLENCGISQSDVKQLQAIAKNHGMNKVLLNINESNVASAHICEKLGGIQMDTISVFNNVEGEHAMRRYWIYL